MFYYCLFVLVCWLRQIDDYESAMKAGDLFGYPLMIKSKRLAYDGRGNAVAHSKEDLSSCVAGICFYDFMECQAASSLHLLSFFIVHCCIASSPISLHGLLQILIKTVKCSNYQP